MKTIKTLVCLFVGMIASNSFAQNTFGDIIGTFLNNEGTEGVFGATVVTTRGEQVYKAITEEDGRFKISAIPAGEYNVYFIYEGDTTYAQKLTEVVPDGYGDVGEVRNGVKTIDDVKVIAQIYYLKKGTVPEIKLTAKDIKHMPNKFDPKSMVASMTSEVQLKDDGSLVFRGARQGDMLTYLDGVKVRDMPTVPSASIGYMMVYTGAIPAKYGDTMGGIVVIETVSYFDLLREYQNRTK